MLCCGNLVQLLPRQWLGTNKYSLIRALQQTLPTILTTAFWVPMVSGQSFVLYSRLYLVNLDKRIRRYVLAMIIVNGVVLHTATAVTAAGSNSKVSSLFITPYAILERIQITVFCVQEFILSGLYVWKAWRFLAIYRSGGSKTQDKLRAMMLHLILSNVVVVSLDITIIVLEYLGLYYLQVSSPEDQLQFTDARSPLRTVVPWESPSGRVVHCGQPVGYPHS